uniref:ATP synthase F0 subunit 8 n=1 Tax=Apotamonautes hainanensis TaxID=511355 RepID=A0A650F3K5_9EUCA|nr:ATP synthase F0 subunit 8 [Apotamonautes hainanensis]
MPQMSPLFWLSLFFFFLFSLMLFLMMNYFIKPFKSFSYLPSSYPFSKLLWKL